MSQLDPSVAPFDLSILGITDELPNDTEVTLSDADAAFARQVQKVVRDYTQTPLDSDGGEGGADATTADAGLGDESGESRASTVTDDATADTPPAEVEPTFISDDEDESDAEGASDSSPDQSPSPFLSIPLNDGTTFQLTVDHATDLLRLAAWSQALPERTKYAFAAIESGQAVAIPVTDYEAFSRWQQQQSAQPSLADQIEDVSPEAAARIRELEARVASIPSPEQAAIQQEYSLREQQVSQIIPDTLARYKSDHTLDDAQFNALLNTTVQLGIIAKLTEESTLRAPNGRILRDADHAAVLYRALDMVRAGGFVPGLSTVANSLAPTIQPSASTPTPSTSPTAQSPSPTPAPSSTLPSSTQRVAAKKARASSLASAPSTAVTSPRSTEPLSFPDMEAQVAKALTDAMRNGG